MMLTRSNKYAKSSLLCFLNAAEESQNVWETCTEIETSHYQMQTSKDLNHNRF